MRLSGVDKMLMDRGWFYHGHGLWDTEIGGRYYAYNTETGELTTQDGFDHDDPVLPNFTQKQTDFTTVLALGFSDDWHEPESRMERDKMKLEHMYHL